MERDTDTSVVEAIERHLPGLERYVRSMVRDADEAADICQEACVRLLVESRDAGLPDAPGAWLNRVAHNLVVSAARRRQTAQRRADQLVDRQVSTPLDQIVIDRERDATIRLALGSARGRPRGDHDGRQWLRDARHRGPTRPDGARDAGPPVPRPRADAAHAWRRR